MAGPVKTVCFIASAVIACGLFAIGEAIVAWFDYKINGTEIPWNLELFVPHSKWPVHMFSIVIHGLFLHGIRKEKTMAMVPWMFLYYIFIFVGLCVFWISIASYPTPSIVSALTNFLGFYPSIYINPI